MRSRSAARARKRRLGWRLPVATLLIVIGCLLAPISLLAVWSANQVSDTSRYVANIEPLIHEPAIQNALADKVTLQITSHLNVAGLTNQAAGLLTSKGLTRVGALLKTFSPAIASSVDGFIHKQVLKIVTSPRFERAWLQVNTVAHEQLVGALSGNSKSVTVSNGKVYIDLAPFIAIVKQDLSRARVHPGQQPAADPPDAGAVLVARSRPGPDRLPADQRPQDRAADPVHPPARSRRVRRPRPSACPRGRRPWLRGQHARARRRPGRRPRHVPEHRACQRAAE